MNARWPGVAALAILVCLGFAGHRADATGSGATRVEPVVSAISTVQTETGQDAAALLGAAPLGEPGEAWAFERVSGSTPPPLVAGARLEFAAKTTNFAQPVFARYTDATGWQLYETPAAADGKPLESFDPAYMSAAITPHGGGVIVGSVSGTPQVLIRQPGGRFTVNQPSVLAPGERLADGSRAPATAFETGGRTAALVTATGPATEGVLYFDGTAWSRDAIDLPSGANGFKVLGMDATGPDNAWLVARLAGSPEQGVALFKRDTSAGPAVWREQSLGEPKFADAATPFLGISKVEVVTSTTQSGVDPITVTTDGVWVDGSFEQAGAKHDFTFYFDISAKSVEQSWCDSSEGAPAVCDRRFDAAFSRQPAGYRSTAWAGSGYGTRVITDPRDPGGSAGSNRGTYLTLQDGVFIRLPGAGDADKATSALSSATSGWLSPNVRLTSDPPPEAISQWSVGARAPFNDVAPEPGKAPGDVASRALAVGNNGGVARYQPGVGWVTEFLQSSTGLVRRPNLRAVAWPEAGRAHAVGEFGEMWLWRSETGLWERDPGVPVGLQSQLNDIAFNPANPQDGYVVGRGGTLLHYGKSWTRVCAAPAAYDDCDTDPGQSLPGSVKNADLRSIAFAGGTPIVISSDHVLTFTGGAWKIDAGAQALVDAYKARGPGRFNLLTVAGLSDGAALIAGQGGFAIERESAGGEWKTLEQPLPNVSTTAAALFHDNGKLRALLAVTKDPNYPPVQSDPTPSPGSPAPLLEPLIQPSEGFLLRQTDTGWSDEQRDSFMSNNETDVDRPAKSEPIRAILATDAGDGWVVGGSNGLRDTSYIGSQDSAQRTRALTAFIGRYAASGSTPPSGAGAATPVPQSTGTVNFVVGGNANCENIHCNDFSNGGIAPDRQLEFALEQSALMAGRPFGPRFFMYTGGRRPDNATSAETAGQAGRFAQLLGSQPDLPTFGTVSPGDSTTGSIDAYREAFSQFPRPFGDAAAPAAIDPVDDSEATGARTHYAFDSTGTAGKLRVIVIDNSRGSLEASDPYQNPPVASQENWLRDELRAAKAAGVPAIVIGNRDLHSTFSPNLNRATDARKIARLLRDEGASAYFFDRPEENRTYSIPAGESGAIPSFGTGTLGYRSEIESTAGSDKPSSFFGNTGMLLAQVNVAARDAATNRAPVAVRMIPLIQSLNLDAVDGTLLRRSRPALFNALGRRPLAGDRWGPGETPSPGGSDPYSIFPSPNCNLAACDTRIAPEYTFTSSDPDIADFVAVDPQSSNVRKPLLGANGKPVADSASGLLCPYNAGTTTISIAAGGLTYARQVTVQPGSVRPPCGTVPLNPNRFTKQQPAPSAAPPPPAPVSPVLALTLPPAPSPKPPPRPVPPPAVDDFVPQLEPVSLVPVIPPPPAPTLARPIPPTGGMARAPEKQREEEAATEDSQAFARYEAASQPNGLLPLGALILIAALGGALLPRLRGGGGARRPAPACVAETGQFPYRRRTR